MERFDRDAEIYMNLCLFGEPGVGKTRLCGTVCQSDIMGDVVWADIEGGMITLKGMKLKRPPLVERISDAKELEQLYWALKKRDSDKTLKGVGTLVIDNATDLVPIDLEHVVTRKAAKEKQQTGGRTRRSGIDDVWLDDRGETGRRLGRIFRWFRDLHLNVIMTAHPREIYAKKIDSSGREVQGKLIDVRTEFPQALRRQVEGYQDFVWYVHYNVATDRRRILTERRKAFFAKTRGEDYRALLGPVLEVPTDRPVIPDLYKALQTGKLDTRVYHAKEADDSDSPEEEDREESSTKAGTRSRARARTGTRKQRRPVRRSGG